MSSVEDLVWSDDPDHIRAFYALQGWFPMPNHRTMQNMWEKGWADGAATDDSASTHEGIRGKNRSKDDIQDQEERST